MFVVQNQKIDKWSICQIRQFFNHQNFMLYSNVCKVTYHMVEKFSEFALMTI